MKGHVQKMSVIRAHSFIAVIKESHGKEKVLQSLSFGSDYKAYYFASDDGQIEVAFSIRKDSNELPDILSKPEDKLSLLLGDDCEWNDSHGDICMANAVSIGIDLNRKSLKIMSSIVGLPPIFQCKISGLRIITSDLYFLSMLPGVQLFFDIRSIHDLFNIGHPIDHRTLFKDVAMIPAGSKLQVDADTEETMERAWRLPQVEPLKNWDSYINLQIEAFNIAMKKMNLSDSFLSLSAGLDTRTILAALMQNKTNVPACTMSGEIMSLDARVAHSLCKSYGIKHEVVVLGDEFYKDMQNCILEASRLSGGLVSLEQAHEVYFYKKVYGLGSARLSGNLGNQVGRGGTEKVSMKNIDLSILNDDLINKTEYDHNQHWYRNSYLQNGKLDLEFLLQNEVPFSSVANFCIGKHFSIQQTPYASRQLIESTYLMPIETSNEEALSLFQMRLKDLKHRFLGEGEQRSFQIRFIKNTGGFVASYPINWGWRAKGGVSLKGTMLGSLAFLDALASSKGLDSGLLYKGLKTMHVIGLHEYTQFKTWLKILRDFVHDTLSSDSIMKSGLFNEKVIHKMLQEHYSSQRCHYKSLVLALDLALAKHIYKATL